LRVELLRIAVLSPSDKDPGRSKMPGSLSKSFDLTNIKLLAQFGLSFLILNGFQSHFGFKCKREFTPGLLAHLFS
jgi:hypothetical protein